MDGILSLRCVNCTTQLDVICKLAEGALDLSMSLMKTLLPAAMAYIHLKLSLHS